MKSSVGCFGVVIAAGVLAGCAAKEAKVEVGPQRIGMANPASVHCVSKGGKVEIRKDKDGGEFGVCHLPDGSQVDEWELFRSDNPKPAG
ncbi:MAG: putative hemolysin [Stenotrophomonas sp.]|uniref:putative hemolysin n=1 Tax=Stenotrophomonas sp. TaxID=69392 RepID=UPI003D6D2BB2